MPKSINSYQSYESLHWHRPDQTIATDATQLDFMVAMGIPQRVSGPVQCAPLADTVHLALL